MSRPLLVIDGDSFAHRAFHGLPKTIRRRGDKGGGAIVGFANFLLRLYLSEAPRRDRRLGHARRADVPARRLRGLSERAPIRSRARRPARGSAAARRRVRLRQCEGGGLRGRRLPRRRRCRRGGARRGRGRGERRSRHVPACVRAHDHPAAGPGRRDGPNRPGRGARALRRRAAAVPDFIALRGDPSDKLPGARGIGPKGAASLLRKYGSLEEALAKGRFPAQAEALRTYRRIATMNASAPLPALGDQTPTWAKAAALAQEWELTRLADRLAELARTA
ncbi:MAG TPA: 5'-3' exonuclease H3TH domain-containing protein [Beijerinckiaceae bacterium]|nr:5'-3' exonuclease H3TH domain-containing protein [Beijerinckiaceae bacterium]